MHREVAPTWAELTPTSTLRMPGDQRPFGLVVAGASILVGSEFQTELFPSGLAGMMVRRDAEWQWTRLVPRRIGDFGVSVAWGPRGPVVGGRNFVAPFTPKGKAAGDGLPAPCGGCLFDGVVAADDTTLAASFVKAPPGTVGAVYVGGTGEGDYRADGTLGLEGPSQGKYDAPSLLAVDGATVVLARGLVPLGKLAVFERGPSGWEAPDLLEVSSLINEVALERETLVVAANGTVAIRDVGPRRGSPPILLARPAVPAGEEPCRFGVGVAINHGRLLVACSQDFMGGRLAENGAPVGVTGWTYLYTRDRCGTWRHAATLAPPPGVRAPPWSVSLDGDVAAVGMDVGLDFYVYDLSAVPEYEGADCTVPASQEASPKK